MGLLLLLRVLHVGIGPVLAVETVLLDGAGRHPADQVEDASGLVIRSRHPSTTERLLSHDSSGRLVVDVEISCGIGKFLVHAMDHVAVLCKDTSGQTVIDTGVHELQSFFELPRWVFVDREDRAEEFRRHESVTRVLDLDDRGFDEVTLTLVTVPTVDDFTLRIIPCSIDETLDVVERGLIDHSRKESLERKKSERKYPTQ